MELETVTVAGFRSVDSAVLEHCGPLNVLIGKNNAGKSALLSAIEAFFLALKEGAPVSLDPSIGDRIDFHKGDRETSIQIKMDFKLGTEELDKTRQEIIADAPQLRNAAEDLDETLRLSATLTIPDALPRYAYVSDLGLVADDQPGDGRALLMSVSPSAAKEMVTRLRRNRSAEEDMQLVEDLISHFDENDWQMIRNSERATPPPSYLLTRYSRRKTSTLMPTLEKVARESDSLEGFRRELQSILSTTRDDARKLEARPLENAIGTFGGDAHAVPQYSLNLLKRVASTKVLHLSERRQPVGRDEAAQLLSLKVKRGGPEVLRAIQDTVQALLGVDIDAFEGDATVRPVRPGPAAEMDVDHFLVEVNGSGIKEALRLVLDTELKAPDILLVEEPEVHLHPSLEASLMRYLKKVSSKCQVFLTTHSTNFLDTAEMRNVYLVSKPGPATAVELVDFEAAEEKIPTELGIRLSSVFMYDRLVFVEGPTDEVVLRELASTIGVNLSKANVGFVPMGGVRNFVHYAANATLEFLSRRRVQTFFILDRDEAAEDEVASFIDRFGGTAQVHVLAKRELENYLAIPRALAQFVVAKARLGGQVVELPTLEEVAHAIDEAADSLKTLAIEKRVIRSLCLPTFPSRDRLLDPAGGELGIRIEMEFQHMLSEIDARRNLVAAAVSDETKAIESAWAREKAALVPGELLIDAVCRRFGARFRKERDDARLASMLRPEEVPPELKTLLSTLGR